MTAPRRPGIPVRPALAGLLVTGALLGACVNATSQAPAASTSSVASAAPPVVASATTTPTRVTASAVTASAPMLRTAAGAPCEAGGSETDCVQPGRYALDPTIPPGTVTLNVPAGWFEWDPGGGTEGLLVSGGADAPDGSGWGILLSPVGTVAVDPCDATRGTTDVGRLGTAADVATRMAQWRGFRATAPLQTVGVGGAPGTLVELTYAGAAGSCPGARLWTTPAGMAIDAYPMIGGSATRPTKYAVVDTGGGQVLIIRTTDDPAPSPFEEEQGVKRDPARHAQDQVALRSIVDSLRLAP
jgi:hypothetical protein